MVFSPGMQDWFNIFKKQCNHYSDKLKKKVHLIISVDAKIAIDKNPTFISDKTSHQTKRNSLNLIKGISKITKTKLN